MGFADLVAAGDRAVQASLGSVPVHYVPAFGTPPAVDVTGIFDPEFRGALDTSQQGVAVLGPAVFLSLASLPIDPATDDPVITVAGIDYRMREVQKDGMGGVMLHLVRR